MSSSREERQVRGDCQDDYKLCDKQICVPVNQRCPCHVEEYMCGDGRCLPTERLCDGVSDCFNGEDEHICGTNGEDQDESGTPVSLAIGVSIAVFVVAVVVVVLVMCYLRRRRDSFRQQRTGLEPLQSQTSSSDRSTEMTSDSDGYRVLPKNDDFSDDFAHFADALCTSTPRPDIRRQVHPVSNQSSQDTKIKASMLMDIT